MSAEPSPASSTMSLMSTTEFAFAPNVTPGTYGDEPMIEELPESAEEDMLFPPQPESSTAPRKTHNRKKPVDHIPRPPNAFILFRSAFIRNRHVSTGVETNHSTLSQIIGLTWQGLPNEERQVWQRRAKLAEEEHRKKYPLYAFKPLHGKKRGTKRKVREVGPKDPERCAKIAELLVQGKKGRDLDDAVKEFDKHHVLEIVTRFEAPITEQSFRKARRGRPCKKVKQEESQSRPSSRLSYLRPTSDVGTSSCPSPLSTDILSLPTFLEQDSRCLGVPSFDQFTFGSAQDSDTFNFNSFSFDNPIPSNNTLYSLDSPRSVHSLDNAFVHCPSPQNGHQMDNDTFAQCSPPRFVPHLSVNTSFMGTMRTWSPCDSPSSPSTIMNSMPTTPAYAGTPPPPPFNSIYAPYAAVHQKPAFDGMIHAFDAYQVFDGSMPTSVTQSRYPAPNQQLHQHQMVDLEYSSFIANIASY